MWKHVKTCENMSKHVKTCENMSKLESSCFRKYLQKSHLWCSPKNKLSGNAVQRDQPFFSGCCRAEKNDPSSTSDDLIALSATSQQNTWIPATVLMWWIQKNRWWQVVFQGPFTHSGPIAMFPPKKNKLFPTFNEKICHMWESSSYRWQGLPGSITGGYAWQLWTPVGRWGPMTPLTWATPTTRPFRAAQMLSWSFLPCSAALNSSSGTIPWGADREIPGEGISRPAKSDILPETHKAPLVQWPFRGS